MESDAMDTHFPKVATGRLTEEITRWFGDGEYDVDLMLRLGVVTEEQILALWDAREIVP